MSQASVTRGGTAAVFLWRLDERAVDLIRFWSAFAATFGLLLFRGWDRITHPELFAEGLRFMGGVLNSGWASLLESYDFFYHTAPKLIGLLAVHLVPVSDIPLFTNLACYAVTAAAMASVARPGLRWVIPSDTARIALALLMVLAPGLIEVLGNLAGIHWSLLLWLAVISLKDPKHPFTVWELALVALVLLTAGGAIVFLPLAFLRLVFAYGRTESMPYKPALSLPRFQAELIFFLMLLIVTAYLFSGFLFREEQVGVGTLDVVAAARDLGDLLPRLAALLTAFYFLHPFLGTLNTSLALNAAPFYPLFAVVCLVIVLLLARTQRRLDYRFWLIPLWLASLFALAVMLSMVRYWAFYGLFSPPYWDWWFRYNFIFATTGLFFWFMLLRPYALFTIRQWSTVATLVLIGGYVSQADTPTTGARPPHGEDGFAIERYSDDRFWRRTAETLERSLRTGCPPRVEVRGEPGGKWRFVYASPRTETECEY